MKVPVFRRSIAAIFSLLAAAAIFCPISTRAAAPVAGDDLVIITVETKKTTIRGLTNNDTDVDGGPLTIIGVTAPQFGTTTLGSNNEVIYDPNTNFAGTDFFNYTVRDAQGNFDVARVDLRNPFLIGEGVYAGPISDAPPVHANSGYFLLKVNFSGAFTATLRLAGEGVKFKGAFGIDGVFRGDVPTALGRKLLTLNFPLAGTPVQITGDLAGMPLLLPRNLFNAANPAPHIGRFTFLLDPTTDLKTIPQGVGFGTMTVKADGSVRMAGKTGDGARYSSSVQLTSEGANAKAPFYAGLYRVPGSIIGTINFAPGAVAGRKELTALLNWFKPRQAGALYRKGFETTLNLRGATYTEPALGQLPLVAPATGGAPNATFSASEDGLRRPRVERAAILTRPVTNPFEVDILDATRLRASMKINAKTGAFVGKFGRLARRGFSGVIIQGATNIGAGVFKGPRTTGNVVLQPDAVAGGAPPP